MALTLKDNVQCGHYYVNDLTDVENATPRRRIPMQDRFVITTLLCMRVRRRLRLTERRTNKQREREVSLELEFVVYYEQLSEITLMWLVMERIIVQFRDTQSIIIFSHAAWDLEIFHFSLRKGR